MRTLGFMLFPVILIHVTVDVLTKKKTIRSTVVVLCMRNDAMQLVEINYTN